MVRVPGWFSGEITYRCFLHDADETMTLSWWEFVKVLATMLRLSLRRKKVTAAECCPLVLLAKTRKGKSR